MWQALFVQIFTDTPYGDTFARKQVLMYYCLPDFLLLCTYIDKTSDTCGTAVKSSKDEGILKKKTNGIRIHLSSNRQSEKRLRVSNI
jgi:hypothetical protein